MSCLSLSKVLEPDPVDLASVGLGGADAGKGKGPSNGNPDDARWSGEARCGKVLHLPIITILIFVFIPFCSRAGGFENLNQGINIDFGAATTKVLELNVKIFVCNYPL